MTPDQIALKNRTAKLSVASNATLVFLKLIVGFYSGSVSIVSEGLHSAVDLLAAMIALFAVNRSGIPADKQHAYGHGKIENVSGAVEAILIIFAAVWIVYEAWHKLNIQEQPEFLEYGILVMALSIVLNIWVSQRLFKVARETESHALEADALHLRTDVITSAGVLVGLAAMKITGLTWIDPAIAIFVAIFIFKAGYDMTRKSLAELNDVSLPEEETSSIRDILDKHPEVIAYSRLRTRRSGSQRMADMTIALENDIPLAEAHAISDDIENVLKERLKLSDVTIHLEPIDDHFASGVSSGEQNILKVPSCAGKSGSSLEKL